jgi:hypothetical protein
VTGRPFLPGVPAAGHLAGGFWHPGRAEGCPKCARSQYLHRTHSDGRERWDGPTNHAEREARRWQAEGWTVTVHDATVTTLRQVRAFRAARQGQGEEGP